MGSQTCPNEASGTNGKNFNSIIEIVCLDNGVKIPALQQAKYWPNQDLTGRLKGMMLGKYLIQIALLLIEN